MDEHCQFAGVDRKKSRTHRQDLMKTIPYGRQDINQADIDAVVDVLRSDFLTQGPTVTAFEKAVTDHCGVRHALAVNSATSSLHIACLALGVGKGDCVWTTPTTFVASANCALYCGATVDFVDIDPRTYNLSEERLAEKLAVAEKNGKLPKVVIPVHLCGQPCDMAGIHTLGQQYGFKIIEDASHAIGGKYRTPANDVIASSNAALQSSHSHGSPLAPGTCDDGMEPIGNCRYSDITVFSFHPVKIITTGEGGVAVTNDAVLAKRLNLLRSHGITSTVEDMQPRPTQEIWNYQQIDLGFNYRMTDLHAALGLSQMTRLHGFIEKRHRIAQRYDKELAGLPIQTPWQHPDNYSAYHLYPIRIKENERDATQRQVYDAMQGAGINVNLHYIPVYRQPYYEAMGFKVGYCPEAEKYHKEVLSIPIYPTLTDTEQAKVIRVLYETLA
jgi:dTDP-4-amino-4,6-dideoxygalactose transaminase